MRMRRTGPGPLDANVHPHGGSRSQVWGPPQRHPTTPVPSASPEAEAVRGTRARHIRVFVLRRSRNTGLARGVHRGP